MAENKKADLVIKIIIIALIAIFLGAVVLSMFGVGQKGTTAAQQGAAAGQGGAQQNSQGQQGGAQAQAAGQQRQASAQNAAAITVSAQTMERGVIRQIVRLNGDVTSQTEVGIFPDTAGKISLLVKSVGDSVARGEIIGYIDPSRAGVSYEQNPITATVAGTITALPVSQGETVSTSTRIATIGSLGSLKITVYVAEKYSAFLHRGLPAGVSFAAAPNEQFTASAVTVSPVVNSATRTIETALTLARADARIKPGMYANVDLVIREQTGTFVLPKNAVKNYNDTQVVYKIDENNIARRTTVTTGLSNDSEIEILSGISAGDKVITAGAVTDSSPVREAAAFGASSSQ
jgi:multidrug efflux pump subunit AcrA (membrane-fusion protein)